MKIDFLVLDHNNKECAIPLLNSIRKNAKFDYNLVYLHDGLCKYKDDIVDLVDELKENSKNIGCGASTIRLFAESDADYAFYIQVDQLMQFELRQREINIFHSLIKDDGFAYVDLAGNQGYGKYSERAQFINVEFYNSIPKAIGGPGRWAHIKHTEAWIQDYLESKDSKFKSIFAEVNSNKYPVFRDCGKYGIRRNPDGTLWKHRTDTKITNLIEGVPTSRYEYPPFSDEQWDSVIKHGLCVNMIPDGWKNDVFKLWD